MRSAMNARQETAKQLLQSYKSAFSHFQTVGGQRDLSTFSMVPGASAEMVKALNTAVEKLSSMDRTLKDNL